MTADNLSGSRPRAMPEIMLWLASGILIAAVGFLWNPTPFAQTLAAIFIGCALAQATLSYGASTGSVCHLHCDHVRHGKHRCSTGFPFGSYHFEVAAASPQSAASRSSSDRYGSALDIFRGSLLPFCSTAPIGNSSAPLISSRCPWSRRFQVMFGPSDARRSLRSTSITLFGSLTSANVTRSGKSFGAILRGPGMRPMRGTSSMKSCDGASPYGASPYNGNISLISGPPSRLQRIPLSGEAHWSATRSAASRRDQGPDTGPRRGACAWCLNRDVPKLHFTAPRERHDGYRREASQARIFRQD
jgi:hypothetical protein